MMLVFCTRENVFSADKVPRQQQQQQQQYQHNNEDVEKMKGYFSFIMHYILKALSIASIIVIGYKRH